MALPAAPDSTVGPDPVQGTVTAALLRLQHQFGWLTDTDLRDLARQLEVPLHELEEVVSFFPHFRREPPPLVELSICRDMACHLRGAADTIRSLKIRYGADNRVAIRPVSCLGRCDRPVAACASRFSSIHGGSAKDDVHDHCYHGHTVDQLAEVVGELVAGRVPEPTTDAAAPTNHKSWQIDTSFGKPTYAAAKLVLRQFKQADDLAEARARLDLIPKLQMAGLRGMGGAGVPAAKKWSDVRAAAGTEKYIVCNADESEPATFKDRELLLRTPHLIVEGVILAGLACGGTRGYIYIRHEYPEQAAALRQAIADAEKLGVCGANVGGTGLDFPVSVFVSPGGYICGEQSALIEAMEGHRAQPRNRPPELATNGLFDKPTLVSNVETFSWVPGIMLHTVLDAGAPVNWYGSKGVGNRGIRFFSISGDVNKPGVYEMPIGAPLRALVEAAGGVIGGEAALTAIAPSGPSGGFLPPKIRDPRNAERTVDLLDLDLDIDVFRNYRAALGAGLVVYAGPVDMLSQAANATEFYRNESCGKCVPCRVGSQKLVEIGLNLRKHTGSEAAAAARVVVRELDRALEQTSICGLGQVAAKPLSTALQHFVT